MRFFGALTLCLLAATPVAFAEAPDAGMKKVRLSRATRKSKFRFAYALPEGRTAVEQPPTKKARLGRDEVLFFDVDQNGVWNEIGIDAWALPKMPYALPLEEETILGNAYVKWAPSADGKTLSYSVRRLPVSPAQLAILKKFNSWRMMNGLPAVMIDTELSDHCAKHCAYMEKHGFEHGEEKAKPGYTAEGAAAGRRSCLSETNPRSAVTMFYATLFHRLPLMHPGTSAIGIGASKRYSAIDGLTRKKARRWQYPVVVPAPNTFAHPTHFAPELPRAHPDGMRCGFPITMTFDRGRITAVKATLHRRLGKRERKAKRIAEERVALLVSWPGHPANPKRPDNKHTICLIPKKPLHAMHTYRVNVRYALDGEPTERTWSFNTGRAGPAPVVAALGGTGGG